MKKNVCIVDDNQEYSEAIENALRSTYTIHSFTSGAALISALRGGLAADVVFTDYKMKTMNGVELCRELHRFDASIPVVLVSGWIDKEVALRAVAAGVVDILEKPISLPLLHDSLHRALALREQHRRQRALEVVRGRQIALLHELRTNFESRFTLAENALCRVEPRVYAEAESRREFLRLISEGNQLCRDLEQVERAIADLGASQNVPLRAEADSPREAAEPLGTGERQPQDS